MKKTILFAIVLGVLASAPQATAIPWQGRPGSVEVTVVDADSGEIVKLSVAHVLGATRGVVAGGEGRFRLLNLPPGTYRVHVAGINYGERIETVEVRAGETTTLRVPLTFEAYEGPQIVVQATRPDLLPEAQVNEDIIRAANPRDVGELLRALPGVDSVRRGPIGFDPVVRGLRETEVGVYLDGSRIFPAGPARMDSAMSHFDPGAVQTVEVVQGPYALTWGAGNLSAVRATTQDVPPRRPGYAHGDARFGFDSNIDAIETVGSVSGRLDPLSYWGYGVYREGSDYEDGDGNVVPGDFLSREVRGKVGYRVFPGSDLTFAAGYQQQRDLDYPGRLLDAELFDALHVMGDWMFAGDGNLLRTANVNVYLNDVDHRMNNDNKPTAQPNPDRMPPFPLDIVIDTGTRVGGARAALEVELDNGMRAEIGGDFYLSNRDASRTIDRRDNGARVAADFPWPDVDIDDYGVFGKVEQPLAGASVAATVRLDIVRASANDAVVSQFFLDNTEGSLDAAETNVSAALTASLPAGDSWVISAGLGSAVRTADAAERYSDRFPASKAQFAAEFIGDPQIRPERSTQADIWVDGRYGRMSVSLGAYYRHVGDYITIAPTGLPKKLPLSPPTVFRYVNGDARFAGFEYKLAYRPIDHASVFVRGDYIRATDTELDEPALGISPVQVDLGARYANPGTRAYDLEGVVHVAGEQNRVATTRGETPTDGHVTFDLTGGARVYHGLELRAGVLNLFDDGYVNHLNSKNPFTGLQVAEPGRVLFVKASYSF